MGDTLVVAISQSGTTTDTNRTVDLVRARGAAVVAIVNRRNSDLTDKADGVLYTSDGRDVEMASPRPRRSTRRSRPASCWRRRIARRAPVRRPRPVGASCCDALRELPEAMEQVLARRDARSPTPRSATRPSRRYWAVVGNGPNRIAADEIRIKLSELCYKSIACDATEDKKHIDLSSEPLILVCAAGLDRANADDVAKEVAIYRAHKAAPIVIASEGEDRFTAAARRHHRCPRSHPDAGLRAVGHGRPPVRLRGGAGHRRARPARCARRAARSRRWSSASSRAARAARAPDVRASRRRPPASSTGCATASTTATSRRRTAVRLASLLRYATGARPARVVRARARQGRHAERAWSRT